MFWKPNFYKAQLPCIELTNLVNQPSKLTNLYSQFVFTIFKQWIKINNQIDLLLATDSTAYFSEKKIWLSIKLIL